MPTYEYACTSCGHEWEAEQSIKEAPLTECAACHKATAKRQISRGGGFILKGGGWYSDLYASSSNKKPESSDTSASDKSTSDKGSGDKGSSGSSTPDTSSSSSSSASSGSDTSGSSSKPSTGAASSAAA